MNPQTAVYIQITDKVEFIKIITQEFMRLFHICAKKVYEKDGEKKIKWYKAGVLKETDSGRRYIRFFHLPMIDYFVFENNPAIAENKSETTSA